MGIGTGCACEPALFAEMGCDVSIVCDDGSRYWGNLQYAIDGGHPIIRVSHGTSEEPGMATLTEYLRKAFPDVRAEHLPHRAAYRLCGASTPQSRAGEQ